MDANDTLVRATFGDLDVAPKPRLFLTSQRGPDVFDVDPENVRAPTKKYSFFAVIMPCLYHSKQMVLLTVT